MKKIVTFIFVFILFSFTLVGCFNVFSPMFKDPTSSDLSNEYDVTYLVEIGDHYADIGDYINAKRFYERALEVNPTNARALIGVATCEFFSIVPRTNFIEFYSNVSSNTSSSNYVDFINKFVEDSKYYQVSKVIRDNLYIIISSNSDDKRLADDINIHLNFSLFNKVFSLFDALDSDRNLTVDTNDIVYRFILDMTNSSNTNFVLSNDLLFLGDEITKSFQRYFSLGMQTKNSLLFISNKLLSSSNSIEVQLYNAFDELDTQLTNIYTNYYEKYSFYLNMYNRITDLLKKNGISNVNSIFDLTNALNVTNYQNFDYTDITNILTTNDSDAWDILTNYLDLNKLTNG